VNSNYNISPKQRRTQQLVAQFNADEELWFSLESKRRRRRKLHSQMSAKLNRQLDLLEFARARPPQDCIGFWQATLTVFEAIPELMAPPEPNKRKIGFLVKERAARYGRT
jgi:hypothetical protein